MKTSKQSRLNEKRIADDLRNEDHESIPTPIKKRSDKHSENLVSPLPKPFIDLPTSRPSATPSNAPTTITLPALSQVKRGPGSSASAPALSSNRKKRKRNRESDAVPTLPEQSFDYESSPELGSRSFT